MKKILAISGSPRRWGNTELLLEEFLKEFKKGDFKIKKIVASELKITPCNNCGYCSKKGTCIFKDDMTMVYDELSKADCVVIASPVYFTSLPGQLKILIDRCQVFWARFYRLKKHIKTKNKRYGAFLSVCGYASAKMFTCAAYIVKVLYHVLGVELFGKVNVPGIDRKGDILKKEKSLLKARQLAKKLIKELGYDKG